MSKFTDGTGQRAQTRKVEVRLDVASARWSTVGEMGSSRHPHVDQPQITTVLFDYSGVLTTELSVPEDPPFDVDAMFSFMLPALMGQEAHAWHELERGEITVNDWIGLVEAAVPGGGAMFDPESELNAMARLEPHTDHLDIAADLRHAGLRVGLLTNNVAEWRSLWRDRLPCGLFHVIIDSAEVGMRKPEHRIYELAMAELGVLEPSEVLLIDDFEWNVAGAAELGMATVHCTAAINLRSELQRFGLLLS